MSKASEVEAAARETRAAAGRLGRALLGSDPDLIPAASNGGVGAMLQRVLGDLRRAPVPQQLGAGAAVGFTSGYVTVKVGKMAATIIGGSLLLLQIAQYKGYVSIDWSRLGRESGSFGSRIREKIDKRGKGKVEQVVDFAKQNSYLAGGFVAAFFLGVACA